MLERSADIADVVLAEIRGVPRDRAVVGIVVKDGQVVMSRRGVELGCLGKHLINPAGPAAADPGMS